VDSSPGLPMFSKMLDRLYRAVEKPAWRFGRVALEVLIVAGFLLVAIYLESSHQNKHSTNKCEFREAGAADESEADSAQLAIAGYRDLRSRRVTVVTLREGIDPDRVFSICEQRWYIAKLIEALVADGATEIVIDKFYGPRSCATDDLGTINFLSAVQHSPIPVVVGRQTHAPKSGLPNSCLILNDSLDFGNKVDANGKSTTQPALVQGITRLDTDIRKIPLTWSCYSSDSAFAAGEQPTETNLGTLSWVAASVADSGLMTEPRLVKFRTEGQHPFTSFIDLNAMASADALAVLCASSAKEEIASRYHADCAMYPLGETQIKGRIVVIGEDVSGQDQHVLFGHSVPGVYLQANYIESLLDDRPMQSLSSAWNLTIFVSWLIFIYLIFWFVQPEIALVLSLVVVVVARFLVTQFTFHGLYPHLWVQDLGLALLVIKYIDSRGHSLIHHLKGDRAQHNPPAP
jgi:CHASE2 domain